MRPLFALPLVFVAWCMVVAALVLLSSDGHPVGLVGSRSLLDDSIEWERPLFENVNSDIMGTILAFVTVMVASGGGIGGGGLLVPLYILVLNLGRFAIPLSKATIFGSAISNLIINAPKRHPKADRPLISFDITLMLEPTTLGGTIVGVLLNTIFPSWLITVLLILLLGFTTNKTLKKASGMWKKESEKMKRATIDDHIASQEIPEVSPDAEKPKTTLLEDGQELSSAPNDEEIQKLLKSESKVPWLYALCMVGCWCTIFIAALFKGGHGAGSIVGMECGSASFWMTNIVAMAIMAIITCIGGVHLHRIWAHKKAIQYPYQDGDVQWDSHNAWYYPTLCTFAGIAAGLLGIGGGMVKGPLMLGMGVQTEVAAATSAFMILFTSSATTMQFVILGMLRPDYTAWYGMIGFLGGWIGKMIVGKLIKKYNRPSLVVFCLGAIIGLSCVVMGISGLVTISNDISEENWDAFSFHSLCAE